MNKQVIHGGSTQFMNQSNIEKKVKSIAKAIIDNKLVLFVGAGLSRNLQLPSWGELVAKLGEKVHLEGDTKEEVLTLNKYGFNIEALERVLDYTLKNNKVYDYGVSGLRSFVVDLVKAPEDAAEIKKRSDVFKYLPKLYELGLKRIVTTNYDNSIETCIPKLKGENIITSQNISKIKHSIIKNDEYYLKIHGGIDDQDSLVLFESDYRKKYVEDDIIPELLQELFTHNCILFLGCGLSDKYLEIYERLKAKDAVMDSYVVSVPSEHRAVADRDSIQRIILDSYSQLGVFMQMLYIETRKQQREKCKEELFRDLPLKNYNYESAKGFFETVSHSNVRGCYFFNTQVEFSSWLSPALQMHLYQQMDVYHSHSRDMQDYKHYRVLFLPYESRVFGIKIADSDDDYGKEKNFKHEINALVKIHEFMHCNLYFITTDVFAKIIDENPSFFCKANSSQLTQLGLNDILLSGTEDQRLEDIGKIIQRLNDNGYRNKNDLDFATVDMGDSTQIWQADYVRKEFKYSQVEGVARKAAYVRFSDLVLDFIDRNGEDLQNPKFDDGCLREYLS